MIPFEYFAPPGDSEAVVCGPEMEIGKATALVGSPLIVNGVECPHFKTITEGPQKGNRVQAETPLQGLGQKVKVKNPGNTLVYLRLMLELKEAAPKPKEKPPKAES